MNALNALDWVLPPPSNSLFGVLLRARCKHIITIIQLLLRGGSTQALDLCAADFGRQGHGA